MVEKNGDDNENDNGKFTMKEEKNKKKTSIPHGNKNYPKKKQLNVNKR